MQEAELDTFYEIEIDLRGETLIYREPARGRRTAVIYTFGARPILLPRTLENWWYPATLRSAPMSPAIRAALVDRIVQHARNRLGISALEVEA